MIKLTCKNCESIFYTYPCRLSDKYGHKAKFCSKSCANQFNQNGKETRFKKGSVPYSKINPHIMPRGKQHSHWKGDKVGYRGLHYWVNRVKGKAKKCEHCGKIWDKPRSLGWANISGNYLRIPSDYIALCASCHKIYDLNRANADSLVKDTI